MTTKNPRIYVTLQPDTHAEIVAAAKQFNTSISKVAGEILEMGISAYMAGLPLMPQDAENMTDEEFAAKMMKIALERLEGLEEDSKN